MSSRESEVAPTSKADAAARREQALTRAHARIKCRM